MLAIGRGMSALKRIERTFARCARNWSALFAQTLTGKDAFSEIAAAFGAADTTEDGAGFFFAVNSYALEHGVNAVFASRASILLFRAARAVAAAPHNPISPPIVLQALDSS
jgi:hypothetical protein